MDTAASFKSVIAGGGAAALSAFRAGLPSRGLDGRDAGEISTQALWPPPSKIAGRRLAPFLDALDAEAHAPSLERRLESVGIPDANP